VGGSRPIAATDHQQIVLKARRSLQHEDLAQDPPSPRVQKEDPLTADTDVASVD
jgi:hypothetical protein